MSHLSIEEQQKIFSTYGKSVNDSGSSEAQIALFTTRVLHLTEHLKKNRKDFSTQRALLKMVGKRRRLLDYVKEKDIERYRSIIKLLNLRK